MHTRVLLDINGEHVYQISAFYLVWLSWKTGQHERVQNHITYKKRRDSAGPIYKSLNILPLNGLLLSEQAKFLYQFTNNMLPQVFMNYMSTPSHNHNTRFASQQNFSRTRVRTNRAQNTLECLGPKVWSKIPLEVKQVSHFKAFKSKLKTYLLENDV